MTNQELYDLGKQIAPFFAGVFAYGASKLLDQWKNRKRRCNVSADISKNTTILSKLIEARLLADCDRVKLYQFYNGDFYVSGQSIVKCAVTHMSVKPGVAPQVGGDNSYQIPIGWLHDIVKPLLSAKFYHLITEELQDSDWKATKLLNEDRALHIVRLGSPSNMRGFLEIAWHDDTAKMTPEIEKEIIMIVDQLNGVLIQG